METESSLGDDEDEGLQIPMDQLLDDFEEMKMAD
jgi:nonsense-mediated mRNA decay protein 3